MKINFITLLFLFSYWAAPLGKLTAQSPKFINFSVNEGLPSSNVYCAHQDNKGYMWFATNKGVSKFNGKKFINYSTVSGLSDDEVFRVFQDSKERLWFATANGEVSYYLNGKFFNPSNDTLLRKIQLKSYIWQIFEDVDSTIWFIANNSIAYKLSHNATITKVDIHAILGLFQTSKKNIYAIARREVFPLSKKNNRNYYISFNDAKRSLSSHFYFDKPNNNLFLSRGNELLLLHLGNKNHETLCRLSGEIIFVSEANSLDMWVGTHNGVYLVSKKGVTKRHWLENHSVTGIFSDHENNTWFTTQDQGVFLAPAVDIITYGEKYGLDRVDYFSFFNNSLLAFGDHLSTTQITPKEIKHFELSSQSPYSRGRIKSIHKFNAENLFVASDKGLFLFHKNNIVHSGKGIPTKAIYVDIDSSLYFSTSRATYKIPLSTITKNMQSELRSISQKKANTLILYPSTTLCFHKTKNTLWAGTSKGLMKINSQGKLVTKEPLPPKQTIYSITSTNDSTLWLAMGNNGLKVLINNKELTVVTLQGVFCNYIVTGENPNEVWVGTNKGVVNVVLKNKEFKTEFYNFQHGIGDYEVNSLQFRKDTLWIATNNGITVFPTKTKTFAFSPVVHLKDISVNNRATSKRNLAGLKYFENSVTIRYDGISLKDKGDLTYYYTLEGSATFKGNTKDSKITFEDLKPGTYKVTVYGENSLGFKSAPFQTQFTIHPPWWTLWWFKLMLLGVFVFLIYLFFRIRILTYNKDITRELLTLLLNYFKREKYIIVRSLKDGSTIKVNTNDILWIEGSREYIAIITTSQKLLTRKSMKEMEKLLSNVKGFMRIHKSYIVNVKQATGFKWNMINIGTESVPIGRTYKEKADAYLKTFKPKQNS
jgi:ligand-binding sensor domain-containing protein